MADALVARAGTFFLLSDCQRRRAGWRQYRRGRRCFAVRPARDCRWTNAQLLDGNGALEFGESAALTLGVTYGLKYTVNEKRPNGGGQSFPSAHTSISFSSAEFMRKRYGWEYGIPAYAAASFVAYSRVEAGEHHPHDVVAAQPLELSAVTFSPNHTKAGTFRPMPMANILESGSVVPGSMKVG